MDWATAAAIVSDRTPDLSDAPDPPGDDLAFWQEVQRLVDGDGLQENIWEELKHPRGRGGEWVTESLHEGEHFRALRVNLPKGLPHAITVGGQRYERHPDPHVSLFDSRRAKQVPGVAHDDALMKQMADTVQQAPVNVKGIGPPWRVAEKGDRRALVLTADVEGVGPLYDKLSEQAGADIPVPPTHVTAYTTPGKKGIGLGLPEEWRTLTRTLTPAERADLPETADLQEADYAEALHPRDRTGKWMAKLGLNGLREVGGAPRDDLLGKNPKDIDYMAMETPERIKAAVEAQPGAHAEDLTVRDRLVGVRATHPDLPDGGVEIVPPRVEESTGEGRKDFAIIPHPGLDGSESPERMTADDAMRRDFTVNAIYRDPKTGELTDPTGHGVQDSRNRVLRMVHDQSFQEDPLRMLRGARFAAQHALEPEPATLAAMKRDSGGMTALTQKGVSGTVQEELRKILMSDDPGVGLRLMRDTGMFQTLLPELAPIVGFDQNSMYHEHVLDEHTFEVIDELARQGASYEARLAALFHDSGKPLTANLKPDGTFRFHSHPVHGHHADVGAEIARKTLTRLNFPRDTIDHVSGLVREHMVTAVEKPTPVKARRLRARFSDKFLQDLLDHKAADMEGHGEHIAINRQGIQKLRDLLAENADAPRSVKDLMINGSDLIAAGVQPGPEMGKILRQLLTEVINQPNLNRRKWLLGRAEKLAALGTQEWAELEAEQPELEEADIYTEALHPRDRLGKWMTKEFGEQLAQPGNKRGRKARPYRAARWIDTGQDFHTMAHEAARLLHPEGTPEEHAAIAAAVVADKPPLKTVSQKTKDVAKKLRDNSTPDGPWGRYIYRLHGIASDAHEGQTDHAHKPYIQHVEAVADSVSDEAKPVALFHDALEDTQLRPEELKAALTEPKVMTPEDAQTIVDAIQLLSRPDDRTPGAYERYVEHLKNAPGKAGELAREVKRADLQHNLGRMTPEIEAAKPNLKPRYEAALEKLAPTREPITQRGAAKNVNDLDRAVVYARLLKLYEASEAAGTAAIERDWYQTAHDQIEVLAKENDIDPHTLAAMVAATSPQLTWRHEFKSGKRKGEVKYPNLDLAIHAAELARKYPDEPAPKLVDRLVAASVKRTPEERKLGPSELGGLGESVLKAIRIYRGEDPERVLGAPKTRSFANNLTYPDQATTVTMDEHMGRAVLGKSTKENYSKSTEGVFDEKAAGSGYTWAADIVAELAKDKEVLPHQAQAIIWVAQKAIADAWEAEQKKKKKGQA